MVDTGPGSFARLGEAKLFVAKADIVLLTHLHVDHAGELPGLIKARAVVEASIAQRFVGPVGLFYIKKPKKILAGRNKPASACVYLHDRRMLLL